jgi:hypothetical protein
VDGRLRRKLTRVVRGPYSYDWNLFSRVSPDDVYIMAFPRSGTTWLRCLLASYHLESAVTPPLVDETVPDVYRSRQAGKTRTSEFDHMGVFKSHSPYLEFPARVIYLVRDGRDALLSFYHYSRKVYEARHGAPPAESPSIGSYFLAPTVFGTWHDHVLGWLDGLERRPAERRLVLRYEDLVADPRARLAEVIAFLGREVDDERIGRAVEWNTKQRLAAAEGRSGGFEYPMLTKDHWSTALTPEEVESYERVAGDALIRMGYMLSS